MPNKKGPFIVYLVTMLIIVSFAVLFIITAFNTRNIIPIVFVCVFFSIVIIFVNVAFFSKKSKTFKNNNIIPPIKDEVSTDNIVWKKYNKDLELIDDEDYLFLSKHNDFNEIMSKIFDTVDDYKAQYNDGNTDDIESWKFPDFILKNFNQTQKEKIITTLIQHLITEEIRNGKNISDISISYAQINDACAEGDFCNEEEVPQYCFHPKFEKCDNKELKSSTDYYAGTEFENKDAHNYLENETSRWDIVVDDTTKQCNKCGATLDKSIKKCPFCKNKV